MTYHQQDPIPKHYNSPYITKLLIIIKHVYLGWPSFLFIRTFCQPSIRTTKRHHSAKHSRSCTAPLGTFWISGTNLPRTIVLSIVSASTRNLLNTHGRARCNNKISALSRRQETWKNELTARECVLYQMYVEKVIASTFIPRRSKNVKRSVEKLLT